MEILKEFQFPKSSLLNLLNVIVDCGFLIKSERNQYALGIKNYELGCQALHRKNILEITKRPMQELSLKSGLHMLFGSDGKLFRHLSRQGQKPKLSAHTEKLDW